MPDVNLTFRADMRNLTNALKSVPGLTEGEAQKMVIALEKNLKKAEAAAKASFQRQGVAAKEAENALQSLLGTLGLGPIQGAVGNVSALTTALEGLGIGGVSGAAVAGVGAVAAAAVAAGYGIYALANAADDFADSIELMGSKMGTSLEETIALRYAVTAVGGDMDTVSGSVAKLTATMDAAAAGSESAQRAFERLGVDVTDADGNLRSVTDVLSDTTAALSGMGSAAERTAAAQDLLGTKSAAALLALSPDKIDAAREATAGLAEATAEAARQGAAFEASSADLSTSWEELKVTLGGALIPIVGTVTQATGAVLDLLIAINGVTKYVNLLWYLKEGFNAVAGATDDATDATTGAAGAARDHAAAVDAETASLAELAAQIEGAGVSVGAWQQKIAIATGAMTDQEVQKARAMAAWETWAQSVRDAQGASEALEFQLTQERVAYEQGLDLVLKGTKAKGSDTSATRAQAEALAEAERYQDAFNDALRQAAEASAELAAFQRQVNDELDRGRSPLELRVEALDELIARAREYGDEASALALEDQKQVEITAAVTAEVERLGLAFAEVPAGVEEFRTALQTLWEAGQASWDEAAPIEKLSAYGEALAEVQAFAGQLGDSFEAMWQRYMDKAADATGATRAEYKRQAEMWGKLTLAMFIAEKVAAAAKIAIQAPLILGQAVAQLGPIAGPIAAGAVIATQVAGVAAASMTQPTVSFASGGTVPSAAALVGSMVPASSGMAAAPAPTARSVTTARDHVIGEYKPGEATLTESTVRAAGGPGAIARANAGLGLGGGGPVQINFRGRVIDEMVAETLASPGRASRYLSSSTRRPGIVPVSR